MRTYRFARLGLVWACAFLLHTGEALGGGEISRYFMYVFGSESKPKKAKWTHTWGCVVKANGTGDDLENYDLEMHSISWMPAAMVIKPHRFIPEKGVNLGLKETFEWAVETDQEIMQWGPYEVPEFSFYRWQDRIAELESGKVKYQCIDPLIFRARTVSDCIHGVSDLDPTAGRTRYLLTRFGEDASRHVMRRVYTKGILLDPETKHLWLNKRLSFDQYPIVEQPLPEKGRWKPVTEKERRKLEQDGEAAKRSAKP